MVGFFIYRQYVGQEPNAVSMASGILSDKTPALTARASFSYYSLI